VSRLVGLGFSNISIKYNKSPEHIRDVDELQTQIEIQHKRLDKKIKKSRITRLCIKKNTIDIHNIYFGRLCHHQEFQSTKQLIY
jgi:hypothetical protein